MSAPPLRTLTTGTEAAIRAAWLPLAFSVPPLKLMIPFIVEPALMMLRMVDKVPPFRLIVPDPVAPLPISNIPELLVPMSHRPLEIVNTP